MLTVILAITLGLIFTFISVQNTVLVPINLFGLRASIPLYLALTAAMLVGAFIMSVFGFFEQVASYSSNRSLEGKLNKVVKQNETLQQENIQLKESLSETKEDLREEKVQQVQDSGQSLIQRIKHSLSI